MWTLEVTSSGKTNRTLPSSQPAVGPWPWLLGFSAEGTGESDPHGYWTLEPGR